MKFVLLGADPACLPLVRAIAHTPQHELTLAAHCGDQWAEIAAAAPGIRRTADWQALLIEPDISAAIVAGSAPDVLDGARALARAGVPLVVCPDLRQTAAFAYDLWPIEDEGRTLLVPLFPHDAAGDALALRQLLQTAALGRLRFVQLERTTAAGADGLLPLSQVENTLLHDADLLRRLCGDYARVTCLPVGLTADGVALMSATLAGDGLPEATWRVSAATGPATARVTISGEHGSLVHDLSLLPTGVRPFAGVVPDRSVGFSPDRSVGFSPRNVGTEVPAPASISPESEQQLRLLRLIEQRLTSVVAEPRWSDVVRAFDVVDAARRSIRRRRTIEIGSEDISEVRQFKSLMTAAGCGVLMYTLLGVVGALLIGAVADPRDAAQRRAASADFILHSDEFTAGVADLNANGRAHVAEIAPRLWQTTADVIIQPQTTPAAADINAERRTVVAETLRAAGAANVAGRVVTRPLAGQWFEQLMIGVWVAVFLPLGIVLALQLLGFAARPDKSPPVA